MRTPKAEQEQPEVKREDTIKKMDAVSLARKFYFDEKTKFPRSLRKAMWNTALRMSGSNIRIYDEDDLNL